MNLANSYLSRCLESGQNMLCEYLSQSTEDCSFPTDIVLWGSTAILASIIAYKFINARTLHTETTQTPTQEKTLSTKTNPKDLKTEEKKSEKPTLKTKGYNCASCPNSNAHSLCGRCKKVAYCDARCQKAHWATHKFFCPKPWYENDALWDTKVTDSIFGCVRRAKDFFSNVSQHCKTHPNLEYFVISRNENDKSSSLSYEDSRDIRWKYHVVLLYSIKGNRYILDTLKSKKCFEYTAWKNEITQGAPDKFKCLALSELDAVVTNQLTKQVKGALIGDTILKIDQDL